MKEKFWLGIVNLLPRTLVYWCAVRVIAHATTGRYSNQVVPELAAMDALKRWNEPNNIETALWTTIDDIDTATDQHDRGDLMSMQAFYDRVCSKVSERFDHIISDGYDLSYKS